MSVATRISDLSYRLYDGLRHRKAFEVARSEGAARDFSALRGHKYALVVTFKRSGEPVPTPVWFGLDEQGRLYFRSEPRTAKVRRLRNEPHVRIAPCSMRGKPAGPTVEGRARLLPAEENAPAEAAIRSNYGLGRRIYEAPIDRSSLEMVYVEVSPV
jgi:PPOX class probable F420-dependent enzyme